MEVINFISVKKQNFLYEEEGRKQTERQYQVTIVTENQQGIKSSENGTLNSNKVTNYRPVQLIFEFNW